MRLDLELEKATEKSTSGEERLQGFWNHSWGGVMSLTRQNVFRIWSLPTVGPMAKDRLLNSLWILWSSLVSNALGNVAKNGTFFNCCLTNSVSYLLQWHFQIFWCGYCINDKIMLYFCCVTQCFSLSLITHKLKLNITQVLRPDILQPAF